MKRVCMRFIGIGLLFVSYLSYGMLSNAYRTGLRKSKSVNSSMPEMPSVKQKTLYSTNNSQENGSSNNQAPKDWYSQWFNKKSFFSYIPFTAEYEIRQILKNLIARVSRGDFPTDREIDTINNTWKSSGYDIWNMIDDENESNLLVYAAGYLLAGNVEDGFSINEINHFIKQLYSLGARLDDNDKVFLKVTVTAMLLGRYLSPAASSIIQKSQMRAIINLGDVLQTVAFLGVSIDDNIDTYRLQSFLDVASNAQRYDYMPFGSVSRLFVKNGIYSEESNDLGGYSLDGIKNMIKEKNIPFLKHDIDLIMNHFSRLKGIREENGEIVTFDKSIELSLKELHMLADKGILRQSLLELFRLKESRNRRVLGYVKSEYKPVCNKIYDLLVASNKVEVAKKLNEYAQLYNAAFFVRGLSYQPENEDTTFKNDDYSDNAHNVPQSIFTILGLKDTAKKSEIDKARRAYLMANHPDYATSEQDKKRKERLITIFNSLWDQYTEQNR